MEQVYLTAPVGLGFLDPDLRYRQVNRQLAAFNGVPVEEHLGRTVAEVIPRAAPQVLPLLAEVLRTGRPILKREIEAGTRAHQEQARSYQVSYYPLIEDGQILGIHVLVEDVTAQKISETALRESEKRYRTLFQTTGDGILIINDAGRYVDVNQSFCRILKTTRERLIGAHFSEFIPPDRLQEAEAAFRLLQAGGSRPIDFPLRAADGSLVDLSWTASTHYLPGLYFCVCREAAATVPPSSGVADQLSLAGPILATELEPQKLADSVTATATRLTGAEFGAFFQNVMTTSGESYLLYSSSGLGPEEVPPERAGELFAATFRRGGAVRIEDIAKEPRYTGAHPFGSRPVRSYLGVPVVSRSGEILGGLFFGHSAPGVFTERHETSVRSVAALTAIAMDNARLFEQAQWVQAELKRSNEDLRRANRDLETFAYSASHDIQEPLRNVSVYTQLLERRLGSAADEETSKFILGILKGTERMHHLVEDLLSYSRATRHTEGPVPMTDAAAVLSSVLQVLKTRIEQARAAIEAGPLPRVRMHEVHLTQLFQNLVSNALKYRSEETPRIRIEVVRQDGWWLFSVADNGIGIDPKYRAQIFGLFKRLHSRDHYSGSGVGLAICQRIVEHYGGRIWADGADSGNGSIFRFTIPDRPGD